MNIIQKLKKIFKSCDHKWVFNSRPFLLEGGMTKVVELRCTKCNKIVYKDLFSKLPKLAVGTYIFCPNCNNELMHKHDCLIDYVDHTSTFKCSDCGCESDWYMEKDVPIRAPRNYKTPEYIANHIEEFKGLNWRSYDLYQEEINETREKNS